MKLAAISDIHGNLLALQAVLADIATQQVDATVNLGDLLSGPLQPAQTADLLMASGATTIAGNHERQLLDLLDQGRALDPLDSDGYTAAQLQPAHVAWLRTLPPRLQFAPDVLLCHGTPGSDLQYWMETTVPGFVQEGQDGHPTGMRPATLDEVRARAGGEAAVGLPSLVLCGHTHVPRALQLGGTLVVNPGSVGLQAYADAHPHPHVVEVGTPHARYALLQRTAAGWRVDLRAVPYDHAAQAEVALGRGRAEWAHALRTGWALRSSAV